MEGTFMKGGKIAYLPWLKKYIYIHVVKHYPDFLKVLSVLRKFFPYPQQKRKNILLDWE